MGLLCNRLSDYWNKIQASLFPWLEKELDPISEKQQQLITILELVKVELFFSSRWGFEGRPQESRSAISRAFIAKMVYNMDTTVALIDRLGSDSNLRRICGWETKFQIPSESTFSRAFAEFANSELPQKVHAFLIKNTLGEEIVSHLSRDSTAIDAREKPQLKSSQKAELENASQKLLAEEKKNAEQNGKSKRRGRPKKGEEKPLCEPEPRRIEKQLKMSLTEMLEDLPKECNVGAKKNSKGNTEYWIGYKLHLDIIDGGIPISAIVTSASMHDSQAAIPLATMSAANVITLYDLMDAAYDDPKIIEHSKSLGHVPLIDKNPRRNLELKKELEAEAKARKAINWKPAETIRYNERSTAERANSRLKDEFGARKLRVRGNVKTACHLMFGVLVLAADQLMKLVI